MRGTSALSGLSSSRCSSPNGCLPYVRQLAAAGDELARAAWVVQAGTAVSSRTRDGVPNSVNVLHHAAAGPVQCEVERWDYKAEVERFAPVLRTVLKLTR